MRAFDTITDTREGPCGKLREPRPGVIETAWREMNCVLGMGNFWVWLFSGRQMLEIDRALENRVHARSIKVHANHIQDFDL